MCRVAMPLAAFTNNAHALAPNRIPTHYHTVLIRLLATPQRYIPVIDVAMETVCLWANGGALAFFAVGSCLHRSTYFSFFFLYTNYVSKLVEHIVGNRYHQIFEHNIFH